MLLPSPIIFVEAALLLDSLQRNWLTYFSCNTLFFTLFHTGGLIRSVMCEPLNLESSLLPLEDNVSVPLCRNSLFSFSFGVERDSLGYKALVDKPMFGSRTENMSSTPSRSYVSRHCNYFLIDFWIIMFFGFRTLDLLDFMSK